MQVDKTVTLRSQLIALMDEAATLAGEFTGGYSNQFFSAEEFHAALVDSIEKFKAGEETQLNSLQHWFAPTCSWDDFLGMEGVSLANEISELRNKMKQKHDNSGI